MDAYNLCLIKALFSPYTAVHHTALLILESRDGPLLAVEAYVALQQIPRRAVFEEEWSFDILGDLMQNNQALWRLWNMRWPEVAMPEHVFQKSEKLEADSFHDREYVHMIIARFPNERVYRVYNILPQLVRFGNFDLARHFDHTKGFPVLWLNTDELLASVQNQSTYGLAHRPDLIDLPLKQRYAFSSPITLAQAAEAVTVRLDALTDSKNFVRYGYPIVPDAEKQAMCDLYSEASKIHRLKLHPLICHDGAQENSQLCRVLDKAWLAGENTSIQRYGECLSERETLVGGFMATVHRGFMRPKTAALRALSNLCPDLLEMICGRVFGVSKKADKSESLQTALTMLTWSSKYLVPWPFPG